MIIDAHCHYWSEEILIDYGRQTSQTMDQTMDMNSLRTGRDGIRDMDDAGVDKMVLLSCDVDAWFKRVGRFRYAPYRQYNDAVAKVVNEYPDRYVGFAGIDPRRGRAAIDELERCVNDLELHGVKMWQLTGFYPDDRQFYPFYERVEELGVPILYHTGALGPKGTYYKYCHPLNVHTVAIDFPKLTFILAHLGYPWVEETVAAASNNENVFIDISAWQPWVVESPIHLIRALGIAKIRCGIEKILFGSDWPLFESKMSLTQWVQAVKDLETPDILRQLGFPEITEHDKKLILGDNAVKALNI